MKSWTETEYVNGLEKVAKWKCCAYETLKPLDDAYIRLLDHFLGSETIVSPFQVPRITCPVFSTEIKFKLKYFWWCWQLIFSAY